MSIYTDKVLESYNKCHTMEDFLGSGFSWGDSIFRKRGLAISWDKCLKINVLKMSRLLMSIAKVGMPKNFYSLGDKSLSSFVIIVHRNTFIT